jgi:hypothetical protein
VRSSNCPLMDSSRAHLCHLTHLSMRRNVRRLRARRGINSPAFPSNVSAYSPRAACVQPPYCPVLHACRPPPLYPPKGDTGCTPSPLRVRRNPVTASWTFFLAQSYAMRWARRPAVILDMDLSGVEQRSMALAKCSLRMPLASLSLQNALGA